MEPQELRILKLLKDGGEKIWTYYEIAKKTGKSYQYSKKWIYPLEDKGLVIRVDTGGGGRGQRQLVCITDAGKNFDTGDVLIGVIDEDAKKKKSFLFAVSVLRNLDLQTRTMVIEEAMREIDGSGS